MTAHTKSHNPLTLIKKEQWLKFVDLLTENVFALNGRTLNKVEILYTDGGHYPAAYFRLTTISEESKDDYPDIQVSGFAFGFNNDWDDDFYIHPLTSEGFWDDWLKKNSITSVFAYHEVGLRKLLSFIDTELKLLEIPANTSNCEVNHDVWYDLNAH